MDGWMFWHCAEYCLYCLKILKLLAVFVKLVWREMAALGHPHENMLLFLSRNYIYQFVVAELDAYSKHAFWQCGEKMFFSMVIKWSGSLIPALLKCILPLSQLGLDFELLFGWDIKLYEDTDDEWMMMNVWWYLTLLWYSSLYHLFHLLQCVCLILYIG